MKKEVLAVILIIGLAMLFLQYANTISGHAVRSREILLQVGNSCSQDTDCEQGYVCEQGKCALGCLEDTDCSQGSCDLATGRCTAVGECISDEECSGKRCDLSTQKCVECLEQADCAEDSLCNVQMNTCERSPELVVCEDPDGDEPGLAQNKGVFTKSTTKGLFWQTGEFVEKTDYCSSATDIGEYYCQVDGKVGIFGITCSNGCVDGACVKVKEPTTLQPECTETDSGIDYGTKGTIKANYYDSLDQRKRDFEYADRCFTRPRLDVANMNYVDKCTKDEFCFMDEVYCTEDARPWRFDREHRCEFGCEDGACKKAPACTDTDGGKDYFTVGKLSGGGNPCFEGICSDSCYNGQSFGGVGWAVSEWWCEEGKALRETYNCPSGSCTGGACAGKSPTVSACSDPDGNDLSKATVVSYTYAGGKEQTFADTCVGSVGILEGFCKEDGSFACLDQQGKIKEDCRKRCPSGKICQEGACKDSAAQCTDSDGEDKNKAGRVDSSNELGTPQPEIADRCIGSLFVEEAYCNFINQGRIKVIKCEADEVCLEGACRLSPEQCTDSDGRDRMVQGKNSYVDGKGNNGEFIDRCKGNSVEEGICKVQTFISRAVPCPPGTICSDGACVAGEAVTFTCSDTDGLNTGSVGKVTYVDEEGTHEFADTCLSQEMVIENVCYRNVHQERRRLCINGECRNGRCVP